MKKVKEDVGRSQMDEMWAISFHKVMNDAQNEAYQKFRQAFDDIMVKIGKMNIEEAIGE